MEKLKVAFCGAGNRGTWLSKTAISTGEYEVVAVCDPLFDRAEKLAEELNEKQGSKPLAFADFEEMFDVAKPYCVVIACSWEDHVKIAVNAMKRGIAVGMEVGGAYNEQECWDLVNTYEETKTPFMFLENVCFNKEELLATNMIRKGRLGEIMYCTGTYGHDLRHEIAGGATSHHYRLRNYINRNCENYPTHELGPIAKILNINRGNRLTTLVSRSSKAISMHQYINENLDKYESIKDVEFKQGDVFTTMITTENGELIDIKLDTTTPRIACRDTMFVGTKGRFVCNDYMVLEDGKFSIFHADYKDYIENAKQYEEEFMPKIWKDVTKEIIDAGHGGMDYFELVEWAKALKEGKEMPCDVYDAAAWMCITYLSEISIKENRIVEIPDFTRGKYKTREKRDVIDFD